MSASSLKVQSTTSVISSALSTWFQRHPVLGFALLAYGLSWGVLVPIGLAARLGLTLPAASVFDLLNNLTVYGPTLAALIATALISGRAGVGALLRRVVQWRVGLRWYLLVLFGPPLVTLAGASVWLGGRPLDALAEGWPMIFTRYLPYVMTIVLLLSPLGEEPGWRGFALPRLQQRYGPLGGTALLGVLWSAWHLPNALFGGYTPLSFALFLLATFATAFIYTWVYHHTGGSVLLMMLLHSALNTNTNLLIRLLPEFDRPGHLELFTLQALVYGLCAVLIAITMQRRPHV